MGASLYERLGRRAGIERIVDGVMTAHLGNPVVKTRFEQIQDFDRAKRMATEFFCVGAGGSEVYTGKDMLAAHKGLNISEQEYLAVMDDIVGVLVAHGVDDATRGEVIAILFSLKAQIIRV